PPPPPPPPPNGAFSADEFRVILEDLWRRMDSGDRYGSWQLLRFNGHFFQSAEALPLTREDISVLAAAAESDWRYVEPTIFGTLLTRALDPVERHRLGAEYTPREYVERIVRQTVEVPIRERWAPVKARVVQLRETTGRNAKRDRDEAMALLREFHDWMRSLHFLDPACGSGNFLYVALHLVKLVELEVLREIDAITGNRELGLEEVHPRQFHGIEVKHWAREIAELTLWIGYHQFWMEHHKGVNVPEPVLQDTKTLERRDAVLAWDEIVEVPDKSRPDPTPRIKHAVTGKLVPDPAARLPYYEYRGTEQPAWPEAHFIFGNPPYMGQARMREGFGDGYVDALRRTYPAVPDTADYVMYWWYRAARAIAAGTAQRAGLITTNTITQAQNRVIVDQASKAGVNVIWAVADHPWIDEQGSADVRVALTVFAKDCGNATLVEVDRNANVVEEISVRRLNTDLSSHADITSASGAKLLSNAGLSTRGFALHGAGFILTQEEVSRLWSDVRNQSVIKPYLNARDLNSRPRNVFVIDFAGLPEEEARSFPPVFDIVRVRVKPERDANNDLSRRAFWWRFGRSNEQLRTSVAKLSRYIVTGETAKHRFFVLLDAAVAPDNMLVCIASEEGFHLGVLSSRIHVEWALAAGGRLGVGNDPRYNKTLCFDPFPFPDPSKPLRERIGLVAEALDRHRKDALARDERVTMTGMYNVLEKLRSRDALTPKERDIHTIAACGVLKDLHDDLDLLVAEAYGWPWPMERDEILERLVALHDERVEEEKRGIVRWLRPDYQVPRFAKRAGAEAPELEMPAEAAPAPTEAARRPWPAGAVEQLGALKSLVDARPHTPDEATAAFAGARVDLVRRHLDTLALVGEVRVDAASRYAAVAEPL
ncbi:MAG: hypothetical protein JWM27_1612, partial [Gemmatimonadetes bacterium]|nr:hypothetical protein [Gemmatimonadota bacterium]